jgi:hypothetical protein
MVIRTGSYFHEELKIKKKNEGNLFFSLFLPASSDPFVRNFFILTEPLAQGPMRGYCISGNILS